MASRSFKVQGETLRINSVVRVRGLGDFQRAQRQWIEEALKGEPAVRDDHWSEAIAVGSLGFVESVSVGRTPPSRRIDD